MSRTLLIAFAVVTGLVGGSTPSGAQCPRDDGTVPGTPARATSVAAVYIDDRDALDIDDDDDAGGIWVYLESNGRPGLQRGSDIVAAEKLAEHDVDPSAPSIDPTRVGPVTLFPGGFGGGSIWKAAGTHDDCGTPRPDTLLFGYSPNRNYRPAVG